LAFHQNSRALELASHVYGTGESHEGDRAAHSVCEHGLSRRRVVVKFTTARSLKCRRGKCLRSSFVCLRLCGSFGR
jgi:hypothetical protein